MEFIDYKCLKSFLIVTEGVSNISSIKYPKELSNYQFTSNGKFDKNTKSAISNIIETSAWENRLNTLFIQAAQSSKYEKKFNAFCEKTNIKLSDFDIEVLQAYFRESDKTPENNNMFINITFRQIDRYDCPGFSSLVMPILLYIIKSEMGNEWIVEGSDYPTDFVIYRKLNNTEIKILQDIKTNNEIKKKAANEARNNARKLKDQKIQKLIDREISNTSEKFYAQSLKDQAFEIVKYMTFNSTYYYGKYPLDIGIPNELSSIESIKLKPDEKMFKFEYTHPKSYDIHGKPVQNKLACYVISNKDSNYKKLDKVYFIKYDRKASETFNSYIKAKIINNREYYK